MPATAGPRQVAGAASPESPPRPSTAPPAAYSRPAHTYPAPHQATQQAQPQALPIGPPASARQHRPTGAYASARWSEVRPRYRKIDLVFLGGLGQRRT